jgi:hypothetical protein
MTINIFAILHLHCICIIFYVFQKHKNVCLYIDLVKKRNEYFFYKVSQLHESRSGRNLRYLRRATYLQLYKCSPASPAPSLQKTLLADLLAKNHKFGLFRSVWPGKIGPVTAGD